MLTGSCLCGAVAYEADAALERIVHCHCQTCRKTHGTAFSSVTAVPREKFRWTARRGPAGRHRILARQVPPLLHAVRLAHHGRARGPAGGAAAAGLPRHAGHRSPAGPYLAIRRGALVRPQAAVPREARGTAHDVPCLPRGRGQGAGPGRPPAPRPRRHPPVHARPASRVLRAAALPVRRHARRRRLADGLGADRRAGLRAIAGSGDARASARCRHRTIPPHRPSSPAPRSACSASTSPRGGATAPTAGWSRSTSIDRAHRRDRPELRQLRAVHPDARRRRRAPPPARRSSGSTVSTMPRAP